MNHTLAVGANQFVTDGYTCLELAELIERKSKQFSTATDFQKGLSLKVAQRYLRKPAENPMSTPERAVVLSDEGSSMIRTLCKRLEECLKLTDFRPQRIPLDGEFLTRFNKTYPMKLEVLDGGALKITFSCATGVTHSQGLQELLFALPLNCRIHIDLTAQVFAKNPTEFVHSLVRYIGRVIASLRFRQNSDRYSSEIQSALVQLLRESPQLKQLDFAENPSITSSDLKVLVTSVWGIQVLNLADNPQLMNADAQSIAINSPRLQEVSLARCLCLTDEATRAFITECSFLKIMDISKTKVADSLFTKHWVDPNLEELTIEESEVNDTHLRLIAERFRNLQRLNLAGCSRITIDGVQSLRDGLLLDLRRCTQFTEEQRKALAKSHPYSLFLFEEKQKEGETPVSFEELFLVHFSSYLSNLFNDPEALAYLKNDKTLFIRLTPSKGAIEAMQPQVHFTLPNVEQFLANYDVHLELAYEAFSVVHPFNQVLLRLCPYVKQLDLVSDQDVEAQPLVTTWHFPKAKVVNIRVPKICDEALGFIKAPQVTALSLKGCQKLTAKSFSSLSQIFPKLETLDLSHCQISDGFALGTIKELFLADTTFGDDGLKCFGKVDPRLRTLDLSRTKVSRSGLSALELFPLLNRITLNGCQEVDDGALNMLRHSTNGFTEIEVRECKKVTEAGIWSLLLGCKELKTIDAEGCALDPTVVAAVKTTCSEESHLSLSLENNPSYYTLACLFLCYPKMTSLTLLNCPNTTRLQDTLQNCPKLQELTLDRGSLNDEALESIGKCCQALTTFEVHNLSQITKKGVEKLLTLAPSIARLSITSCTKIAKPEHSALSKKFSGIKINVNT